jgi:hypothetical protein
MVTTLQLHRHNCCSRSSPHTFLGNHDFARLADVVPAALLPAAFCLLLTLSGIPGINYGDELATTSTWASGCSDDQLRPPMSPRDLHRLEPPARELLASVQELGAFRRANKWLTFAVLHDIGSHGGGLTYLVTGDGGSLRIHVNPTAQAIPFPVDEDRKRNVLGTTTMHPDRIDIPPRSWAVHHGSGRP